MAWDAGTLPDGSDSKAREVAARSHWPEIRALILVVSAEKKGVSSTAGMQATVATSSLFKTRAENVVPGRMKEMEKAIVQKDFVAFARLTTRDSNSFHACCLDTEPPIRYLNDVSWAAIKAVEAINEGGVKAAYTFDAGPNAVVYYQEVDAAVVEGRFRHVLGEKEGWSPGVKASEAGLGEGNVYATETLKNGVSRVIMTRVGDGPISVQEHLVDENGEPVTVAS